MVARIRTKRIYEPRASEDGYRLLVMRLWPRGIRKGAVSQWEPELGPSRALLKAFRGGDATWEEYTEAYLAEMAGKPELIRQVAQQALAGPVTLLCGCADESRCHRRLLQGLVEKSLSILSQT